MCGDANDDGRITSSDALQVLRAAVGTGNCEPSVWDYNGDGKVMSSDALAILRSAVGSRGSFHPDNYPKVYLSKQRCRSIIAAY